MHWLVLKIYYNVAIDPLLLSGKVDMMRLWKSTSVP